MVKRDAGGLLISQLIALESLLAPSSGEIVDPETGRKYPAPPQIVADKDLRERDHLPLCMDWHNYSSKWLARHNLGLPKILARLMAGEEICATDPDVVRMASVASASRVHIKAILNLTVPKDCKPLWLMGVLVSQLGLKTASRKKGARGQQVNFYSLAMESTTFAVAVLKHREQVRHLKAERERQRHEENQLYQVRMQSQYGIEPEMISSVSTPPNKRDIYTLEGDVDTTNNESETLDSPSGNTWKKLKPCLDLLEGTFYVGAEVIKELVMGSVAQTWLSNLLLRWLSKPISLIRTD